MMKVIYVYVAVVFGGALIAVFYLRAEERGWPSTITFISVIAASSVYGMRRARNRRDRDADRGTGSTSA